MTVHMIKMPDIGEGIAEVELVAWRVRPGEPVVEDQVLADVMTDKATVEIPSPVAGRVLTLGGEVGQVLAVGAELIRIETGAEGAVGDTSVATAPASPAPEAAAAPEAATATATSPAPSAAAAAAPTPAAVIAAVPAA
ncbi:MAG: 2-oxo acid dehydrogenase subunit E2, partial [Burkholderiales bacterium]|nr:2-oxo acid dehydrogenase subunit E2 [Burkholderiales bacterium]